MNAQQIIGIILACVAFFMFGMCAGMPIGWRFREKDLRHRFSPARNWEFGSERCGISEVDKPNLRIIGEGFPVPPAVDRALRDAHLKSATLKGYVG